MRRVTLLLALLVSCVAAQAQDCMLMAGTSNEQYVYDDGQEYFENVYEDLTGHEVAWLDIAWPGIRLIDNDWAQGTWYPYNSDNVNDKWPWAIGLALPFIQTCDDYYFMWNGGNDQLDILMGLQTQEAFNSAFNDLLDAAADTFPNHPVHLIATTSDVKRQGSWDYFRANELAVCEAHPNCVVAVSITDSLVARYNRCSTDSCRRRRFRDLRIHWGVDSIKDVMHSLATFIASEVN